MSDDDPPEPTTNPQNAVRPQATPPPRRSLFEIPPPLKRIFDKFPLVTYGENALPLRAPSKRRDEHVLYIFATAEDARKGRPSFNPACLRWQTYLRFCGVPHRSIPSNNHASPSGALPFLLPAAKDEAAAAPIPSNKLKRWVAAQQKVEEKSEATDEEDVRYEAYSSLLDTPVRVAWLYQLYLNPSNQHVLRRLYVTPCSSNPFVQMTIEHQLRQAAETEIVKAMGSETIIEADVLCAAEGALAALSTLLGENDWFFGYRRPAMFDASVFAYTHLLLDDGMGWEANRLGHAVQRYGNLVSHRNRIVDMYY